MNISRLRQLSAHLRKPEVADHFALSHYFFTTSDSDEPIGELIHDCGTVACIAGHAAVLANPRESFYDIGIYSEARDWLGLNNFQAFDLFEPGEVDDYGAVTPQMAADVIDNLIDTGEVQWSKFI
ncbi:MAG: hypothetical protein ACREEW_14425 [Caulobacteraceae bacterium]